MQILFQKWHTSLLTFNFINVNNILYRAEDAGVTILSEAGVCPGLDHMLAMKCFDEVTSSGGKVGQLYSIQ
jgi:alpha-aminoadipic semialdehyde synthase